MRGISRYIYAKGSELPSVIVANAGSDQSVSELSSISLDGTSSTTTDGGGITSYLWEIIAGEMYTLTTPTASTCGVSGFPTNGSFVVRLTVGDATSNSATDTVTVMVAVVVNNLAIASSLPDGNGDGTLDITGGEAGELINLEFKLQSTTSGDSVEVVDSLGDPVPVGVLDHTHTIKYGQVTLDGSGDFSMLYGGTGTYFSMSVNMIQRSIGTRIPVPSSTTVNF